MRFLDVKCRQLFVLLTIVMSCEIRLSATFEGINKFFLKKQKNSFNDNENETDDLKNPFLEYEIAVSPMGDIIVFAKSSWLLVCGSKWDSSSSKEPNIKYSPNWHGHLQCRHGEKVTSLLCLPFFSYGQTVHGPDWTCIVVGFSTGSIRFYTEGMQELVSSTLHTEPVIGIKSFCSSLVQQKKTLKQDNNDIYVLYETAICIFNGPNLSQTLLNKRNQLAKGIPSQSGDTHSHNLLDFKKYGFNSQDLVTDACYLGQTFMSSHTTFDHLVTASYAGGFNSNYRASAPQTSLIVTSGRKPFVGFHYTLESGNSPVLADVALAVANKIKSSVTANLTDWFGFGNKKPTNQEKPKEAANDQAERLNCRFGLCDLRRHGQSIISSPDGLYSAVSDSLGRVILIENSTGVAQKLWKGFRDAQCGFIMVKEDVSSIRKHKKAEESQIRERVALFMVIYAPKKGLVEIICTHNGRKVSSFKVTKFGRLVYNPRGCIIPTSVGGFNLNPGQVVFVSEEGLTDFLVPFHCALAEDSSKISRDLHFLTKMKGILKMDVTNSNLVDEIEKCSRELKINEVRYQAIELLATHRNTTLEIFKTVIAVFLENLRKSEKCDPVAKRLAAYAELIHNLLSFYEFLNEINDFSPDEESEPPHLESSALFEDMRTTEKELESVLKFIYQIREIEGSKKSSAKVTFEQSRRSQIGKYLSSFDFEAFLNGLERQENESAKKKMKQPCRLTLKANANEENLNYLREHLFKGILLNSVSRLNEWSTRAESSCLDPADLAFSLLFYWCNQSDADSLSTKQVTNFIEVLKTICLLNDPNVVFAECNTESPWWTRLRGQIASSPSSLRSLLAALSCRSITIFFEQEREFAHKKKGHKRHKSNEGNLVHAEWETLSKDTCEWDILISQLQDVALLNTVLNLKLKKAKENSSDQPIIPFDFECQCLSSIQIRGTGRVSELVAKWLAQFGFDPAIFVNKSDIEFRGTEEKTLIESNASLLVEELDKANVAREKHENVTVALDYLALLKSRFPYSLTTSSLLSNLCWEYTAYWYKNVKELKYLEAAAECLKTVPADKIKYGIGFLSWSTYLQQKVKSLAVMTNRVGKVPKDVLCVQEIGLSSDQLPQFLKLVSEYLRLMLNLEAEDALDFSINREGIYPPSSLMTIALSQPKVNTDLVVLILELITVLLLMSSLNIKVAKIFSNLWDSMDPGNFTLTKNFESPSHHHNDVQSSRKQFLKKAITGAVQTVQFVECVPKLPASEQAEDDHVVPSAKYNVDEYKKWLQVSFDLASVWDVASDDLRIHQVCELYGNGLDRLAEEVIPSVNEKETLGSKLIVIVGQRLKHLIEDSKNVTHQLSYINVNLSEWLNTLAMENFKCQNESIDDIEVMARYVASWFSEGHFNRSLAIDIIESLSSFKFSNK